jgi:hypothetical protein
MSPAEDADVTPPGDGVARAAASGALALPRGEAPVLLVASASLAVDPQEIAAKARAIVIEVVIVRYVIACDSLRLTM